MSTANPDDWMAKYEAERAAAGRKARAELRYAAGFLRLLGVERVTAHFDGEGDEGFVQKVEYRPAPPAGVPRGAEEAIEDAVCELLPGGWEVNAGSFGTVAFDTAAAEPEVEHTWREEEEYDEDEDDAEGPDHSDVEGR
ncbi:MAG: hypothetical protein K2X82_20665 [Gemmataceae bacterium]|nr:hypothetical protein [Gemmataceae bacterium]